MANEVFEQGTPSVRARRIIVDPVSTSNATPIVLASIPVNQGSHMLVEARVLVRLSNNTFGQYAKAECSFLRASGGNVTKQGIELDSVLGGITGTKPTVVLTANTSTQSVDVTATGVLLTNLVWQGRIDAVYNP